MQDQTFTIERTYNAPIEKVWRAITDKDQMKQWYFELPEFKPEVGFEFRFYGEGRDGQKHLHICRITEVIPRKKLSHTWTYEGKAGNTLVTFALFPEGENTRIKLTHEGLESLAGYGPDFAVSSFAEGWTMIIGKNLQEFVEKT
jgi:uncharacterized protein YndB with AHSA1/START domain